MKRPLLVLGITLAAFVLSIIALEYLPSPFVGIFALWALVALFWAALAAGSIRTTAAILFGISVGLFLFESMLLILEVTQGRRSKDGGISARKTVYTYYQGRQRRYFKHDYYRGYAAHPNNRVKYKLVYKDRVIFDVTYTIDEHGLRAQPELRPGRGGQVPSVLFFGGSFGFGEGLNDDESYSWLVGELSEEPLATHNFSFHGYGPQQMLSVLMHGKERGVLRKNEKVRLVVYQMIADHVSRAAVYKHWDLSSPRFRLDSNQRLQVSNLSYQYALGLVMFHLGKSRVFHMCYTPLLNQIRSMTVYKGSDLKLFSKMVARSRDIVQERYPGSRFVVLYWVVPGEKRYLEIKEALQAERLELIEIEEILPRWPAGGEIPVDRHPNAESNREIAEYLVRWMKEAPRPGYR
jgi:hypothetical protein